VRPALDGAKPVEFLSRVGGNVPSHEEVLKFVREQSMHYPSENAQKEERVTYA
jgi:hypothetical protein